MLTVDMIKQAVTKVGKKYGIGRAYLFGSYARGEANRDSDVDLLIEKGNIRGLQLSGFRLDLMKELKGIDVDVLTTKSVRRGFLDLIDNDRILIYGA